MTRSERTAKEKANDLILNFIPLTRTYDEAKDVARDNFEAAQECALIAVGEILRDYENITLRSSIVEDKIDFWTIVRVELESYSYNN